MGNKKNPLAVKKKPMTLEEYFQDGVLVIVDDHQNMRRTLRNMLKQLRVYDVEEAEDGDRALNLLKKLKKEERVSKFILLDWNMPRMPGIEVVREVRSGPEYAGDDYRDIPIIMITAEANQHQIAEAGEIGVNGYLIKPFVALTLEERMLVVIKNRLNPPNNVKFIHAGEKYLESGNSDKALACFNEAKKLKSNARIMVHIGEAHKKIGNMEEAQKSFSSATQKNPGYLKAHTAAADLHLEMGNEEKALAEMEKANKISPNNADRQLKTGKIHLNRGNTEKASASFEIAVKFDPQKSKEIAEEFLKSGKAEKAEEYFRKSLESKADVNVFNRLGIALRRQGKWKDAVVEYKRALDIDPRDEVIHFNIAKAYLEGNMSMEAQNSFHNALKIDPDMDEAKAELKKLGVFT